jgi:hypothetical protein
VSDDERTNETSSNFKSVDEDESLTSEEIIKMYENAASEGELETEVFAFNYEENEFDIDQIEKILACSEYLPQNHVNPKVARKKANLRTSTRRKSQNKK